MIDLLIGSAIMERTWLERFHFVQKIFADKNYLLLVAAEKFRQLDNLINLFFLKRGRNMLKIIIDSISVS